MAIVTAAAGLFTGCAAMPEFDETEWYNKTREEDGSLLYASHIDPDGSFFNPWLSRETTRRRSFFLSRLFGRKKNYDYPVDNYKFVINDYSYLLNQNFDSISFVGHASVIIKMNGETVFADPFFSNAALVVRKKVRIKFDFSKVPQRPVVLISHNHYDHLDKTTVKKLIKKEAIFIVPLGLKKYISGLGAAEVYELDWWDNVRLGELTYTLLPAQHWSRRIGQGSGKTLWGGYLIQGKRTVYFSGDTGYFIGFREFGQRYSIDYALLGLGAYEPRWFMHYQHMNASEFFEAAAETGAQIVIPMHFGIISLSEEPITYPLYEIDQCIRENPELTQRIRPLRVGEFIEIR